MMAARLIEPEHCRPPLDAYGRSAPCRETVTWRGKTGSTTYAVDVAQRRVTATNRWEGTKPTVSGITTYDAAGNVVERTSFREDGSVAGHVVYTYDPQGRLVRTLLDGPNVFGARDKRYEYDAAGLLVGVAADADANGKPEHQTVLSYDANGRLVRSQLGAKFLVEYEYDAQGRLVAEKETNDGSQSVVRLEYENGRLAQRTESLRGIEAVSTRYAYDAAGRLVSKVSTGETSETKRYEYDANARQIFERSFDGDGEPDGVLEYDYECPPPG